jgi:hypothetical protein
MASQARHLKPANAETVADVLSDMDKRAEVVGVHRRLSKARREFHALSLKKSGKNTFAGYDYFELGDFLIPALKVFDDVGLGAYVSFDRETASMTIVDLDNPDDRIVLTSPMGSAALKGCHEVQNIGAVETYQRRYLWIAALEIVEHDALDKTTGKTAPEYRLASPLKRQIEDLAPKAGKTVGGICAAYSVENLDDLSTTDAEKAIAALKRLAKEPA